MISTNWTRENLAWLAGLLEGEGSFLLRTGKTPHISMSMTDEDVVLRAHEVAGCGRVNGPYSYGGKPIWKFDVQGQYEAYALMVALLPWLCSRRQASVVAALRGWQEWVTVGRQDAYFRGAQVQRKVTDEVRDQIMSEFNGVRWETGQSARLCAELGISRATLYNVSRGHQ